eukprot:8462075-Pyramimonas_sp.AAC.1
MEDRVQETHGNGFRNLIPRHREERVWQGCGTKRTDMGDRDLMQKERLANRRGGHYRYVPPVQPVLPIAGTGSLSYIDELDRFTRDQAAAEFEQRQQNTAKYYVRSLLHLCVAKPRMTWSQYVLNLSWSKSWGVFSVARAPFFSEHFSTVAACLTRIALFRQPSVNIAHEVYTHKETTAFLEPCVA